MQALRPLFVILSVALVVGFSPSVGSAAAIEDITAANAKGQVVFLVLTDAAAKNLPAARETARNAQKRTPNSMIVECNRSDPAQAAAVKKYRVAGAPVPLVMVIASNGVAVGGSLVKKGAVARLTKLVPTPAKAEYLKVLSQRQTAVVVFSHAKMPQQSPLFEQLSGIVQQGKGKVAYVLVDMADKREQKFITEWKVDMRSKAPTVIVMNPKGQTLGRLTGAPTTAKILEISSKRPCCADAGCKGCK